MYKYKGLYVLDINDKDLWYPPANQRYFQTFFCFACVEHKACKEMKDCHDCLFSYFNAEIFYEWYEIELRNKKLERIVNEKV